MEIRLNKYNSKYAVNEEGKLNVNLSSKTRITPYSAVDEVLDLNELYCNERNNSDDYRIILTINPICSNILFNMRTEVIKDEGSANPVVFKPSGTTKPLSFEKVKPLNKSDLVLEQAIKDTEYSSEYIGDFKYHCGVDIFNNHMLRSDDFIYVNSMKNYKDDEKNRCFNTIEDYIRDDNGEVITEITDGKNDSNKKELHLYRSDSIKSMIESYNEKLYEVDGWVGFNNPTKIAIPIETYDDRGQIFLNKLLNNRGAHEFIDMYPDRTLYSFIPKVNKYRKRLERNWDCLLMYPYKSDYEKFIEINDGNEYGAVKVIENRITHSNSGTELLTLRSLIKHNLKVGDYVRLYYKINGNKTERFYKKLYISKVGDINGDYMDKLFSIKINDTGNLKNIINENTLDNVHFYFKREVNGIECDYYLRKFKEIRDINGERLSNEINKLAYGENIYGDRISQLIFTNKVILNDLRDNLGVKVHDIYLTVIKRNAGRKEWYNEGKYGDKNVEYSHCFGKLTSGFDFGSYAKPNGIITSPNDYNVRKLHNIDLDNITGEYSGMTEHIFCNFTNAKKPKPLEGDDENGIILSDEVMELYGDIVEFDRSNYNETVLEDVYYRFNTEQRETSKPEYYDIVTDELVSDDYDFSSDDYDFSSDEFKVQNIKLNEVEGEFFAGNLMPEGYFYKAHNKIELRRISELKTSEGILINYNPNDVDDIETKEYNEIINNKTVYDIVPINSPIDYGFMKGQLFSFFDKQTKSVSWGVLDSFEGTKLNILFEKDIIKDEKLKNKEYEIVMSNNDCPLHAIYLSPMKQFVWRDILKMEELNNNDSLFNRPFTNGCHYIHENINFFLKRQDPTGEYGLLSPEDNADNRPGYVSPLKNYRRYGWFNVDLSGLKYFENNINDICLGL